MLIEVTKKEMVEVNLAGIKYISFCDSIFYRYTPKGENIGVVRISLNHNGGFDLTVRDYASANDIDMLSFKEPQHTKEITGEEFNAKFQELITKYI